MHFLKVLPPSFFSKETSEYYFHSATISIQVLLLQEMEIKEHIQDSS